MHGKVRLTMNQLRTLQNACADGFHTNGAGRLGPNIRLEEVPLEVVSSIDPRAPHTGPRKTPLQGNMTGMQSPDSAFAKA